MEKLTRRLIESHLMDCVEIHSAVQKDGVLRFAWSLSYVATPHTDRELEEKEWSYEFKSSDSARDFALGWICKNQPDLEVRQNKMLLMDCDTGLVTVVK